MQATEYGELVLATLQQIGITQAEFARQMGISRQAVHQIVSGQRTPGDDMLTRWTNDPNPLISRLGREGYALKHGVRVTRMPPAPAADCGEAEPPAAPARRAA